jgi:hypothetical protein
LSRGPPKDFEINLLKKIMRETNSPAVAHVDYDISPL